MNTIFWSPKGRFVAFANLGRGITQFDLEIFDCDYEGDNKDINKELNANIMAIHTGESYGTTDLEWDPTGRYITTSSSFWKHNVPPLLTRIVNEVSWKMVIKFVISKEPFSTKRIWKNSNYFLGVLVHRLWYLEINRGKSVEI